MLEFNAENAKAVIEPFLAGYNGEPVTPAILTKLNDLVEDTFGGRYGVATNVDNSEIYIYDDETRKVVAELV